MPYPVKDVYFCYVSLKDGSVQLQRKCAEECRPTAAEDWWRIRIVGKEDGFAMGTSFDSAEDAVAVATKARDGWLAKQVPNVQALDS